VEKAKNPTERWQMFDSIFKLLGGLLTAVTVAAVGFYGTQALERRQAIDTQALERRQAVDTNVRLYAQLMRHRCGKICSIRLLDLS
jgi:hypothetical protein